MASASPNGQCPVLVRQSHPNLSLLGRGGFVPLEQGTGEHEARTRGDCLVALEPIKGEMAKRTNKPKPPFQVDVVDQFEGYCEDGYGPVGSYDKLADAIAVARRITEEAIRDAGSFWN